MSKQAKAVLGKLPVHATGKVYEQHVATINEALALAWDEGRAGGERNPYRKRAGQPRKQP